MLGEGCAVKIGCFKVGSMLFMDGNDLGERKIK